MFRFSKRSESNLNECHEDIQKVLREAIKHYDFTVIEGYRGEAEQNEAYNKGFSKVKFPNSKHNVMPSRAVDIVPYPIDWKNIKRFEELALIVKAIAEELQVGLNWGGDWKRFKDYPHWELK